MSTTTHVVYHPIEVIQIDHSGRYHLPATLFWSSIDPLATGLILRKQWWTLATEMITTALRSPKPLGDGDVRFWPILSRTSILLTFRSPHGYATLSLYRHDLHRFLTTIHAHDWADPAAALDAWLTREVPA